MRDRHHVAQRHMMHHARNRGLLCVIYDARNGVFDDLRVLRYTRTSWRSLGHVLSDAPLESWFELLCGAEPDERVDVLRCKYFAHAAPTHHAVLVQVRAARWFVMPVLPSEVFYQGIGTTSTRRTLSTIVMVGISRWS